MDGLPINGNMPQMNQTSNFVPAYYNSGHPYVASQMGPQYNQHEHQNNLGSSFKQMPSYYGSQAVLPSFLQSNQRALSPQQIYSPTTSLQQFSLAKNNNESISSKHLRNSNINMSSRAYHNSSSVNPSANSLAGTFVRSFVETDKFGFVGGEQFSQPTELDSTTTKKIISRETKWLKMFNHWDSYMKNDFEKIKTRARKGIPQSLRAKAWQYLCGSRVLIHKQKGLYQMMLSMPCDEQTVDQIKKDVSRQYPHHESFTAEDGYGQRALFNVLKAYCFAAPKVGYCQAHAPIAAALLIHMSEEEAFWTFYRICERYMPGYYDPGLERIQIDARVFYALIKRYIPDVYRHLHQLNIDPLHFMVDWFLCLFTRNLPWSSVVRVLDQFFCEGMKVIFRFALAIVRSVLGTSSQRKSLPTMEDTLSSLRSLPPEITSETFIVEQASRFTNIKPEELEQEHRKQYRIWKQERENGN